MLRTVLREETRDQHSRLDELVMQDRLSTLASYQLYLWRMRKLYAYFADQVDLVAVECGMVPKVPQILTLISADLDSSCGLWMLDEPATLLRGLATAFETPDEKAIAKDSDSLSAAVGMAYTLEGSALGATHILKAVQREPHLASHTQFLNEVSQDAKSRWPHFVRALDSGRWSSVSAVEGARHAFGVALAIFKCSPLNNGTREASSSES